MVHRCRQTRRSPPLAPNYFSPPIGRCSPSSRVSLLTDRRPTLGRVPCDIRGNLYSSKSRRMLDGSPFALKYLPPNEESRSSGRQGNKERPLSTPPTKVGPPVPESHKNWAPVLPPLK